jgi:hypothetical protein
VAAIWKTDSGRASQWFETACAPAVDQALAVLVREQTSQARDADLRRLEKALASPDQPTSSRMDETSEPDGHPGTSPAGADTVRKLNVVLIRTWMYEEGLTFEELAKHLKISSRTVASMLTNGDYHGRKAVTKLANLMNRDRKDLYQA